MFTRLADLFVLKPTTHPLDPQDQILEWVNTEVGQVEVWKRHVGIGSAASSDLAILKILGNAGRAESTSAHPAEFFPVSSISLWTPNPPGYGGSPGRARLSNLIPAIEAVFDTFCQTHADSKVLLSTNSLGGLSALYLATRHPQRIGGLLIRNPPPLRELIRSRFPWWATAGVAETVPMELCTIRNAARCDLPVAMVTSTRDSLVFPHLQDLVYEQLKGPKRRLLAQDADHDDPIPEHQNEEYSALLQWLYETSFPAKQDSAKTTDVHR